MRKRLEVNLVRRTDGVTEKIKNYFMVRLLLNLDVSVGTSLRLHFAWLQDMS